VLSEIKNGNHYLFSLTWFGVFVGFAHAQLTEKEATLHVED